jgi:hypothetical protein
MRNEVGTPSMSPCLPHNLKNYLMGSERTSVKTTASNTGTVLAGVCLFMALSGISGFGAEASIFAVNEIASREQGFTLAGLDITQRVSKSVSIAGRILPNYLSYKYLSGDAPTKASAPGLYAVAGVKLFWRQTTFGLFGGVEARRTTLTPDNIYARIRGSTLAGLVQGEVDSWLSGKTNVNMFTSYSGLDNYFYEKVRVKRQISNQKYAKPSTLFIGMEQFVGRNADYQSQGVGASVELYFVRQKASVGARGGFMHDSAFKNGPYWGLQFSKGF